jgi:RNA polymerase sigma factor (TIGR02999 family)
VLAHFSTVKEVHREGHRKARAEDTRLNCPVFFSAAIDLGGYLRYLGIGQQLTDNQKTFPRGTGMSIPQQDVTQLLHNWQSGDAEAMNQLMPLVYDELRKIAAAYLHREGAAHTLQTVELVNEAYLRLIDQSRVNWQSRSHFYGIAAQMMRRILVDHAREKQAAKRGSGEANLTLDDALQVSARKDLDILALDDALKTLSQFDARQSQIVELRYFGGLELTEVATVLGIGLSTVKRDWNLAKAWLYNQLSRR